MKLLRLLSAVLLSTFYFLLFTFPIHAIDPFEPFSKEGNPPEEYYYESIFPLFRYIKPPQLKVYENRDRSRNYQDFVVCSGQQYDTRDYICDNVNDGCDGGNVGICRTSSPGGPPNYYAHSGNGSCTANKQDPPGTVGKCRYRQTPRLSGDLKATDFSAVDRSSSSFLSSLASTPTPIPTSSPTTNSTSGGIVYHKLQGENEKFDYSGNDNPITWGTHRLQLTQDEQIIKQLLVLYRAKQTKETLRSTGEWPLGWVDWGYKTVNGKSLDQIASAVPGDISSLIRVIAEGEDDFFLNAGNLDAVSDTSLERQQVIDAVNLVRQQQPIPIWLSDVLQSPVYSPSFRQGYARGSICVWNKCCPGPNCPFPDALFGNSKGLYGDISISQAFGASLEDLRMSYPLEEGTKMFNELAQGNPLIRFAGSASANAVPSKIHSRLTAEIKNKCLQYVPDAGDFTLGKFGFIMDYANPPTYLDPNKQCPGWAIQPELEQQKGGAFPQSLLSKLISLVWGGGTVDDVDMVKYHLITIPDAMGQFISEIQEPVFLSRDLESSNKISKEHYESITNVLDATNEYMNAGKSIPVGDAQNRLSYFTCTDPDYSNPLETGIEAYALGTRIGCFESSATGGMCDGARWEEVIGETNITPLTSATSTVMNSAMFKDGQLNPDLAQAYAQVEKETGVPCEVLAGHHFAEGYTRFIDGSNPAEYSAANGGYVGKSGFLESVRESAKGVLRHFPSSLDTFITEASNFNGGGNSNCQLGFKGGTIPYTGCPRKFIGEDDPYAVNQLDARHSSMYLLYCDDFKPCIPPKPYGERPGVVVAALVVHNAIKNTSTPLASTSPSPTSSPLAGSGKLSVNPLGSCGDGFIDTGLGCIPYERQAFVSALLSFLVGISGVTALGTMGIATIQIMTSAGDKGKLSHGKELFAAGIAGLLFIIFSVTLLRVIAGNIIKLPGF